MSDEKTTIKGLERTLVKTKVDQVFQVLTLRCSHCGHKDDYKDNEFGESKGKKTFICNSCHEENTEFHQTRKPVTKTQVAEILSNEVAWKCKTCGKIYKKPQLCCNKISMEAIGKDDIHLLDRQRRPSKDEPYLGYMCDGCKTIYRSPCICCSGSMMFKGMVYPKPTIEQIGKLNALNVPIIGVVQ